MTMHGPRQVRLTDNYELWPLTCTQQQSGTSSQTGPGRRKAPSLSTCREHWPPSSATSSSGLLRPRDRVPPSILPPLKVLGPHCPYYHRPLSTGPLASGANWILPHMCGAKTQTEATRATKSPRADTSCYWIPFCQICLFIEMYA